MFKWLAETTTILEKYLNRKVHKLSWKFRIESSIKVRMVGKIPQYSNTQQNATKSRNFGNPREIKSESNQERSISENFPQFQDHPKKKAKAKISLMYSDFGLKTHQNTQTRFSLQHHM